MTEFPFKVFVITNTDESRGIRPEEFTKKVNRAVLLTLHIDFNQIKTIYAPHPEEWRTPPVCDPVCLSGVLGCVRGSGLGCRTAETHNNTLISSHYIKKKKHNFTCHNNMLNKMNHKPVCSV